MDDPAQTTTPTSTAADAPGELSDAERQWSQASNAFGFDLWKQLSETTTNRAIAPASLSLALGMTASGAAGETRTEMCRVLRYDGLASLAADGGEGVGAAAERMIARLTRGEQIHLANRLFGERTFSFEQPFLARVEARYGAPLQPIDFRTSPEPSRAEINEWVSEQTDGLIPTILPAGSVTDDTALVLTNGMHFKGQWANRFDPARTRPLPFHLAGGTTADVPTMAQAGAFGP
jgi:serpin B